MSAMIKIIPILLISSILVPCYDLRQVSHQMMQMGLSRAVESTVHHGNHPLGIQHQLPIKRDPQVSIIDKPHRDTMIEETPTFPIAEIPQEIPLGPQPEPVDNIHNSASFIENNNQDPLVKSHRFPSLIEHLPTAPITENNFLSPFVNVDNSSPLLQNQNSAPFAETHKPTPVVEINDPALLDGNHQLAPALDNNVHAFIDDSSHSTPFIENHPSLFPVQDSLPTHLEISEPGASFESHPAIPLTNEIADIPFPREVNHPVPAVEPLASDSKLQTFPVARHPKAINYVPHQAFTYFGPRPSIKDETQLFEEPAQIVSNPSLITEHSAPIIEEQSRIVEEFLPEDPFVAVEEHGGFFDNHFLPAAETHEPQVHDKSTPLQTQPAPLPLSIPNEHISTGHNPFQVFTAISDAEPIAPAPAPSKAIPHVVKPVAVPYHPPLAPVYPFDPPVYKYAYSVDDDYAGILITVDEARDEHDTHGSYKVALSDGRLQSVQYTSSPYGGYKAKVEYKDKHSSYSRH